MFSALVFACTMAAGDVPAKRCVNFVGPNLFKTREACELDIKTNAFRNLELQGFWIEDYTCFEWGRKI